MPEDMPDRMPEDMSDRMPEDMPDRMPEDMPEDLPVRKCINVMVGITRSKVILSTLTTTIAQYHSSIVGFEVSKVPWGGQIFGSFQT